MPVITQNLVIPANVVKDGTIQAEDVLTLYNTFNAFTIPDLAFSLVDDTLTTLTGLPPKTKDYSLAAAVAATKALLFWMPFKAEVTTAVALSVRLRLNNADVTTDLALAATAITRNCALIGYVGPRSTDLLQPLFGFLFDQEYLTTGIASVKLILANVDLPTSITSIGFSWNAGGVAADKMHLKHLRVWKEG